MTAPTHPLRSRRRAGRRRVDVRQFVHDLDLPRARRDARDDVVAVWMLVRRRPARSVAAVLAVTVVAGAIAALLTALVTSPLEAPGAFVGTGLTLLLVGLLVWAVGGAAAVVASVGVRWLWWLMPSGTRHAIGRGVRRGGALAAGTVAIVVDLGIASTTLTVALAVVIGVGLVVFSRRRRRHEQLLRWLRGHLAGAAREFDPDSGDWDIRNPVFHAEGWLVSAEAWYPATLRVAEPARRATIERALMWAMRHEPRTYVLTWAAGVRMARIGTEAALPTRVLDGLWPPLPGIVVGACPVALADARVATGPLDDPTVLGLRTWNPDDQRDLLIAGVKGSGKTILSRGLLVRGLRAGWFPAGVMIIDGKASADYAALEGREGVHVVARSPQQWRATFEHLVTIMQDRYDLDYAYESGQLAQPPDLPRMGLMIDEVQAVVAELGEDALQPLSALARMARGARITLIVATQRPDAKDAIPGAIRDQLEDRVAVGWLSTDGAQMVLGDDWRLVVDDQDPTGEKATASTPRGRAVVRIAGRLSRLQVPWLDSPVRDPGVEPLYPRRETPVASTPTALPKQRTKRRTAKSAAAAPSKTGVVTANVESPDGDEVIPVKATTSGTRPRRRGRPTA